MGSSLFPIDIDQIPTFTQGEEDIIAVVDDDEDQLELIRRHYQRAARPNRLILFHGPGDFITYMKSVQGGLAAPPTLILLDINMPGKTGFEVLQEVRAMPGFEKIPLIVMFSVSPHNKDILQARQLGANAYLTKPTRAADYQRLFSTI